MTDLTLEGLLSYVGEKPSASKPVGRAAKARPGAERPRPVVRVEPLSVTRLADRVGASEAALLKIAGIPVRTFQRRRSADDRLSESESDRLLRIARISWEAERVFGDAAKARRWMTSQQPMLAAVPLELLGSDRGADAVKDALVRIEFSEYS